ncbi:cytochrome P450, partial [Corynespora cassiicola Philippines]
YRIFFHPLLSYPGPFVAKFTDWYGGYHALRKDLHTTTHLDHEKYGNIICHGPNKLVFNSAQALHVNIYQNERLSKSRSYLTSQPLPNVYSPFNVIDKRLHRPKHRIIGSGINKKAMREFEPILMSQIDIFIQKLRVIAKDSSKACIGEIKTVDMTHSYKYLGLDTTGLLGFGTNLEPQTKFENRYVQSGLEMSNYRSNVLMQFPLLQKTPVELFIGSYLDIIGGWWDRGQMKYYQKLRSLILERKKEGKHAKKDLYSFAADIKDPETGETMRLRDIWSEAAFFMPAGGDTTATALAACFFYLSRFLDKYSKLAHEIRSTFSYAASIRAGPTLASCTYLRAVIDETLRITPPIVTTLWREYPSSSASESLEPLIIDGHSIPPDTHVAVNIYGLHHNPNYFPRLSCFLPSRWLENDTTFTSAQKKRMYDASMPFSIGSRGCAGKAMAYQEMSLVHAKTFWYLDFESGRNEVHEVFKVKDQFTSSHEGPNLVFNIREGLSGE